MKHSRDHILTTHAGSLPRPDELIAANRARDTGEAVDEAHFQAQLRSSVADVVRRQKECGVDVPGDGEYGSRWVIASTTAPGGAIHFTASVGSSSAVLACMQCRHGGRVQARSC
jgi:methionine synthase II (cobalamin-independent)